MKNIKDLTLKELQMLCDDVVSDFYEACYHPRCAKTTTYCLEQKDYGPSWDRVLFKEQIEYVTEIESDFNARLDTMIFDYIDTRINVLVEAAQKIGSQKKRLEKK